MRSVLVTRPQPAADEFAASLRQEGFGVYLSPLMEYVALEAAIPDLASYQALVFTSAQAVTFFAERTPERSLPVFTVGDATAKATDKSGFTKIWSAQGDSRDVIRLIRLKKEETGLKKILHICGEDTVQNLAGPLAEDDIAVDNLLVYKARLVEQLSPEASLALQGGQITTVTLFSARAAANFVRLMQKCHSYESC